jgi:NTE family protein
MMMEKNGHPFQTLPGIGWLLLVFLVCAQDISASGSEPDAERVTIKRPVVGLVLSGGGARGISHVGVLKVLEELRVPVDIITGTSMGAIAGGLYASGYSPGEMEKLLADVDWDDIFIDKPPRSQLNFRRKEDDYNFLIKLETGLKDWALVIPTGLVQGQKLNLMLKSLTLGTPKHFDDLPVRFRAVAADIETGEAVVISDGGLATAMRASLSIPGVFAPVEWNGRLLVDGGFANNVPVKLARELGADILIVVDLSDGPKRREELSSPLDILNQTLGFEISRNSADQLEALGPEDVLIQPDMGNYSSTDFKSHADLIARGVSATTPLSSRLKRLSLSENDYKAYQASLHRTRETSPRIDNIVIDNQSRLSTAVVKSHIEAVAGERLDLPGLERDLARLYGLNIFKSVDYDIVQAPAETQLVVRTEEKDWGPSYVRFGINLESDLEGSNKYNVAASYTRTPINASGGEWYMVFQVGHDQRFLTELFQPLDKHLRYHVNTWAAYSETHYPRYESGRLAADYIVASSQIGIGAGRLFDNWGILHIQVSTGSGDTRPIIGDLSIGKNNFNAGSWEIGFGYDQLDSLNFPKNGSLLDLSWNSSKKALGADAEQDRLNVSLLRAATWGKNTFTLWCGLGGVIHSDVPTQTGYALGGLFSLSGYANSELSGRYAGVLRLIYFRQLGGQQSVLNIPFYVGGSLETGNVWNDRRDIGSDSLLMAGSLLIALDTPLGPFYLARGFAEGGRTRSYLFLGRSFTFF